MWLSRPRPHSGRDPPPPLVWCMCVCTLHCAICVSAHVTLQCTCTHCSLHHHKCTLCQYTLHYTTLFCMWNDNTFSSVCNYLSTHTIDLIHCLSRLFSFLGFMINRLFCWRSFYTCLCPMLVRYWYPPLIAFLSLFFFVCLSVFVGCSLIPGRLLQQNFRGGAGGNSLQQQLPQQPQQQQVRAYPANNYGEVNCL